MTASAKRVRLTVLRSLEETRWTPREGVPESRESCPDTSKEFCPYYRCRFHLARIDACDRAGRPSLAELERDARGLTVSYRGDLGDDREATLDPLLWLNEDGTQKEHPHSCALDEIDRHGKMTNKKVGEILGRHRTLIARKAKSAVCHAVEAGELRGISAEDLTRTIIELSERLDREEG